VLLARRPDQWQAKLQCRDTAPGLTEVTGIECLELWCAGRVIGDNKINVTVLDGLPKSILIGFFTNRWTALKQGIAVADRFGMQG